MRIAPDHRQRSTPAQPQDRRRENDQAGGYSCRYVVGEIVEPRRRPAEADVARVLISDHGIHGVDRFVCDHSGDAEKCEEKQWCDDTVTHVLRNRFEDGTRNFSAGQVARIPSDDLAYEVSGFVQVSAAQCRDDLKCMIVQAANRDTTEDPIHGDREAAPVQGSRHESGEKT